MNDDNMLYYDEEFNMLYCYIKREIKCQFCGTTIRTSLEDPADVIETCKNCKQYEDQNNTPD